MLEQRIAERLSLLRAEQGWSLDVLADKTGLSRATLSRIERGELSPTAAMLGRLCTAYGWTLSRLMAEAEAEPPNLVRAEEQVSWEDPESRYVRRIVSPPGHGLHAELVEVRLPPGATVSFATSPAPRLEHHLWMIEGALDLTVEGTQFHLHAGDCLRYLLNGPTHFACSGKKPARYVVAIVRP
jgi:transcriptional regulator with XRE-family HTH domain